MEIKDLVQGQSVEGMAGLVKKASIAETKAGKPFLRLEIMDKTGSIEGVLWDYDAENFRWLKEAAVVSVNADVGTYNGALQLKYAAILHAPSVSPDSFAKTTRFDVEEMWAKLVDTIGTFEEPLTKFVAEEILTKHGEVVAALKRAPAARGVHNAWYGGLLEHIWSLCQIAEPVIKHYKAHYFPKLSRDKVLFGLMLHDAGKIVEYDYSNPAFLHTGLGILANHMVLGPAWVYEACGKWLAKHETAGDGKVWSAMSAKDFKMERAQLMHVLAAHHGKVEWGSPVKPATVEAVLVHFLDNLDSRMLHAYDYVVTGKPGGTAGFSERSWVEGVNYLQHKD